MERMKTYEGWAVDGRVVRKGERADYYLVSPDGKQCRAVFAESQTEVLDLVDGIWNRLVPAADRPKPQSQADKDRRPKVRVSHSNGFVGVWCGSNRTAIGLLKEFNYRYDRYSRRWVMRHPDPNKVAASFEDKGFNVIRDDAPLAVI
jgi:hypothetical protein